MEILDVYFAESVSKWDLLFKDITREDFKNFENAVKILGFKDNLPLIKKIKYDWKKKNILFSEERDHFYKAGTDTIELCFDPNAHLMAVSFKSKHLDGFELASIILSNI